MEYFKHFEGSEREAFEAQQQGIVERLLEKGLITDEPIEPRETERVADFHGWSVLSTGGYNNPFLQLLSD